MVGNNEPYQVIRTKLGNSTGEVLYQTTDGRWWKKYDGGDVGTGDEVVMLIAKAGK